MSKGTILVTGGSGYIGSHTVVELVEHGYDVVSVDDHSRSDARVHDAVRRMVPPNRLVGYPVDVTSRDALHDVFRRHSPILGVIHLAAYKSVGESVDHPMRYYENNLLSLFQLLH